MKKVRKKMISKDIFFLNGLYGAYFKDLTINSSKQLDPIMMKLGEEIDHEEYC